MGDNGVLAGKCVVDDNLDYTQNMFLAGKFGVGHNGVLAGKCVVGDK